MQLHFYLRLYLIYTQEELLQCCTVQYSDVNMIQRGIERCCFFYFLWKHVFELRVLLHCRCMLCIMLHCRCEICIILHCRYELCVIFNCRCELCIIYATVEHSFETKYYAVS